MRSLATWRLRTRALELGRRTLIMGVVNITPDSFSDGGLFLDPQAAIDHALRLIGEGADLLDLGAESTRPGSRAGGADPAVSAEEELARLLPVLAGILKRLPHAVVSVDTYKAATARAALAAGAEIINDVSGFNWDSGLAEVCAEFSAGVVLMHTRGRPEQWRAQSRLAPDALLAVVRDGLAASLVAASRAGIPPEAIVLDPGYGFGKRFNENYAPARPPGRAALPLPSARRRPQPQVLSRPHPRPALRRPRRASRRAARRASRRARKRCLATLTAAILNGASIVRVHSVRPAVEAARIADAVCAAS